MVARDFLKSTLPPHPYTRSWHRKHRLSSAGHTPSSPNISKDCSYCSTDDSLAFQEDDHQSFKHDHQTMGEFPRRRAIFADLESHEIPGAFSSLSISLSVVERGRSEPLCRYYGGTVEQPSPAFTKPTPPRSPETVHTGLKHYPTTTTVLRRSPRFKSSPLIKGTSRRHLADSPGGQQRPSPFRSSTRETARYGNVRFSYLKLTEEEYKGLLYSGSDNLIEFMTDYDLSIAKKVDLDMGKRILNFFGEVAMLDLCEGDPHVVKKRVF